LYNGLMRLEQALQDTDMGGLRIIASRWGIEITAPDTASARTELVQAMLQPGLSLEVFDTLKPDQQIALQSIAASNGRMPWTVFTRRFGEVRQMGPGKRDRERPDLSPISTAEDLWYGGWIARAFLDVKGSAPQEYVLIPEELLDIIPVPALTGAIRLGRQAVPLEYADIKPATDKILDDITTLLAGVRNGFALADIPTTFRTAPREALFALCQAADLLTAAGEVSAEDARKFLEAPRGEALVILFKGWVGSSSFNELRLMPDLLCEGPWDNQPQKTRQVVLAWLKELPQNQWWHLQSFIDAVKDEEPDFQRPSGDYDSWFIRARVDQEDLRGFENWDKVDGAMLRYMVTGPLHWLGWMDLAEPRGATTISAFRPSSMAVHLIQEQPPVISPKETQPIHITSDGSLRLLPLTPRAARYQVARFADWVRDNEREYVYRLSPASLRNAQRQGLKITHLVALLKRHGAGPVPPSLLQALERWESSGTQVKVEAVELLRTTIPEALEALTHSRASRYVLEVLTPTTALLRPGSVETVMAVLTELGYLTEHFDVESTPADILSKT
jgi:hypothetical protein